MDKARFVEVAPPYYALAIVSYFSGDSRIASLAAIREMYTIPDEDVPEDTYCLLAKYVLIDHAIKWLVERDIIEEIRDDFGPSIFRVTPQASDICAALTQDQSLPFFRYALLSNAHDWLLNALSSLNSAYDNLGITAADFEAPDQQWEPLPLNRDDQQLQNAIAALDKTIEQVRADNGYNATLPEERNYVLDGLTGVSKRLKEATSISVPYLQKYALEPLALITRRFTNAALGLVAAGARAAIIEFLKQHGIKLLQSLWGG